MAARDLCSSERAKVILCSKASFLRRVNQHKSPLREVVTARNGRLGLCFSGWVRRLLELGDSRLPGLKGRRTVGGAFPSGVVEPSPGGGVGPSPLVGGGRAEPAPGGCSQVLQPRPSLGRSPGCPPTRHSSPASGSGSGPLAPPVPNNHHKYHYYCCQ